jgi:hypothetical protein
MTETDEITVQTGAISEAVALIDRGLTDLVHRELVSSNEVADLLLDVRTLLNAEQLAEDLDEVSPN